jgi:hypothetical protein
MRRAVLLLWLAVLIHAAACGGHDAPVHEISSAGSHPLPVRLLKATGHRDGYAIAATYVFGDDADTRLEVDVELHVEPQAVFDAGRWTYEGPTGRASGNIVPRSIRFTGGQSDGISLGGVFTLREADRDRFEVDVPLTNLQPPPFR